MIAFADTSALYAVLDRDDENHQAARATWDLLLKSDAFLVTSNYVLVETCALVQHRLGLDALRTFQDDILPLLTVEWISRAQHDSAIAVVLSAGRKGLSLVDCVSFGLMRSAGLRKAFAFDRHFVEQGFDCGFIS
jgi:predicted nucleic acid-binding protein